MDVDLSHHATNLIVSSWVDNTKKEARLNLWKHHLGIHFIDKSQGWCWLCSQCAHVSSCQPEIDSAAAATWLAATATAKADVDCHFGDGQSSSTLNLNSNMLHFIMFLTRHVSYISIANNYRIWFRYPWLYDLCSSVHKCMQNRCILLISAWLTDIPFSLSFYQLDYIVNSLDDIWVW